MQQQIFPSRPAEQHRLMERMANARVSPERAREIIGSPAAYRAFVAELHSGDEQATGRRR